MNYNQFKKLSCYEEFEIQSALTGISKIEVLYNIGFNVKGQYWFFVSNDGIFNWFDSEGNHIEDPGVLKELKTNYFHYNITKCVIPDSLTNISDRAFQYCESLKEITIPNSITNIEYKAFWMCESLTSIIIPDSVKNIGKCAFQYCESLKEVIFKGKTLDEVKQMKYYPFGIEDESIIKCEM